MEITIKGNSREIADIIAAVQGQHKLVDGKELAKIINAKIKRDFRRMQAISAVPLKEESK